MRRRFASVVLAALLAAAGQVRAQPADAEAGTAAGGRGDVALLATAAASSGSGLDSRRFTVDPIAAQGSAIVRPAELPADAPRVAGVELLAPDDEEVATLHPLVDFGAGDFLSRRAVRRSVQRLYETGRFANVTARALPADDGRVLVRFFLESRRPVTGLTFIGLQRLGEAALLRAISLREGVEFSADRVDAAVEGIRRAYARVGYEQAQVEPLVEANEEGVEITLAVREGPPTRLSGIRFVGDPGDGALVRSHVTLQPGAVLDRARLESELEALRSAYREAGYWRSRIGPPSVEQVLPGLSSVEIEVRAGPRLSFAFRGNRIFDEEQLRQAMSWEGDEILDGAMIRDLAARIERAYRLAGWIDARVFTTEEAVGGDEAKVIFHVVEGRPLYVAQVEFDGNGGLTDAQLHALFEQAVLASRGPEPLLMPLDSGELDAAFGVGGRRRHGSIDPLHVYDDELYAEVVEALRTRYRDEGYLEAEIDPPVVTIDEADRVARVRIPIEEGRQTRIVKVEMPGADSIDQAAFLRRVPALAVGEPLSDPRLRGARLELQSRYAREGFLYASAEVEVERPPEDPYAAVVRLRVSEGPQVRAGRILVQGNARTDPSVIEDALLFREGAVVGSEDLSGSQQRLMRLGIFRTVAIRPLDPDVPEPTKDLVVDLRERPKRALEVGGGVSIADGPRAFAEFTERNIFGRNLEFNARARVNYQAFRQEVLDMPFGEGLERYLDLGLRYPRIYGLPLEMGWRADLIHERDIRPAYELSKYSALTGVDWPALDWLTAALLLEVESNTTARSARIEELYGELSRRDLERLRFPEGNTLLGSIRPQLVLDLRDDPTTPQAGVLAKLEADYSHGLPDDSVEFFKTAGSITGYVPLARRTSIAISVGGGRIFQLNERSETIWPKRFFLGGAGSLRGFTEDGVVPEDRREELRQQIADCKALLFQPGCTDAARFLQQGGAVPSDGGDLFVTARGELRFPIRGDLMAGVFFDAGNLWLDPAAFDPTRLRTAAGGGLRYVTPVGPVALDLGVNLDRDEVLNEDPFALHFSIGLF